MKLVILIGYLFNLNSIYSSLFENKRSPKNSMKSFENFSFVEKSLSLNKLNSKYYLKLKSSNLNEKIFKAKIYIFKDIDPVDAKPIIVKGRIKLTDTFDIYNKDILNNRSSFLDFLILDGIFLFKGTKEFMNIKSKEYIPIKDGLLPKLEKISHEMGPNNFEKYCSFLIKKQYIDEKLKNLGKATLAYLTCFSKHAEGAMDIFKKEVQSKYTNALMSSKKYLKMQHFAIKQNIDLQYYEHRLTLENLKNYNPTPPLNLPIYFTSLTQEGIIMNRNNDLSSKGISFSFRHDQVVKCSGYHPEKLKVHLKPQITSMFKVNDCCVAYVTDWFNYCNTHMFCSNKPDKWQCAAEIKIFQASIYKSCMNEAVTNLDKTIKQFKGKISSIKGINFLEKARYIYTLKEIIDMNVEKDVPVEFDLNRWIKPIVKNAKRFLGEFLQLIKPECDNDFIKKKINKNKLAKIAKDIKLDNRAEKENLFTLSILSALKYDDLIEELCKEFFKNSLNTTITNNTSKNQSNFNNKTEANKNKGNKTDDIQSLIKDEKERKNNFRLVFQKKFTNDCKQKNKTKNDNKTKPVVPILPSQNDDEDDDDDKDPKTPKNPKIILPIATSNTKYLDDADYYLDMMEEMLHKINRTNNITIPEIKKKESSNNDLPYKNPYNQLGGLMDDLMDSKTLDDILNDLKKSKRLLEIIIETKTKLNEKLLLKAIKNKALRDIIVELPQTTSEKIFIDLKNLKLTKDREKNLRNSLGLKNLTKANS